MSRDQIFEIVKGNILRLLPDLPSEAVTPQASLVDLGANSIDRVEVATYSMEELNVVVPRVELRGATNIAGLVEILYNGMHSRTNA